MAKPDPSEIINPGKTLDRREREAGEEVVPRQPRQVVIVPMSNDEPASAPKRDLAKPGPRPGTATPPDAMLRRHAKPIE